MLPIALRWVSKIHAADPDITVLGSSGVYDHEDVVQYHMAGASAVQICSTIMVRGYSVIRKIIRGLSVFLDAHGYSSVRDIIGVATRASRSYDQMYDLPAYKEKSSIDGDLCVRCGKCIETCWYGAIKEEPSSDANARPVYLVAEDECKGCRNCRVICPVEGAVSMRTLG